MGKIIISQNVSVDGVVQDPTGEEGFSNGGWFNSLGAQDRAAWASVMLDEALAASALLLGRRSDEYFATRWLSRTGVWADRLNSLPKYVVSSTVQRASWGNATVLRGDVADAVSKVRLEVEGDIFVIGSGQLVHALIEHDLADELRLIIAPAVAGGGDRPFGKSGGTRPMRLGSVKPVGEGLVSLTYEFTRGA
jgi:dihydrofolate reductase